MVQDIWVEFLKIAKEEAGSRVVETWFKAVSLQRWDQHEKKVYLQAPNAFVQDWIKGNFIPLIELHLKRLLNVDQIQVVFVGSNNQDPISVAMPESSALVLSSAEHKVLPSQSLATKRKMQGHRSYSFDTFVVGPNNSLAYAAAQAVAENRAPFIILYLFMVIQGLVKPIYCMPLVRK